MPKKIDKNIQLETEISHSMTHYLLSIHKLREEKGYARVTDIARNMGITKGSVSTAINNLKKKGLVIEEEDSKFLLLTSVGHDEVHRILSARTLMFYFLKDFVGVSKEVADKDSCMMEHLVSQETLEKLFNFMKIMACSCSKKEAPNMEVTMDFDICAYGTAEDFIQMQKGDGVLK